MWIQTEFGICRARFRCSKDRLSHGRNSNGRIAAPSRSNGYRLLHGSQQYSHYRLPLGFQGEFEKVRSIMIQLYFLLNRLAITYFFIFWSFFFRFLINCRSGSANLDGQIGSSVRTTLMTQDVVDMAIQVILAMLYLHRHKIIHQDVAARSCV